MKFILLGFLLGFILTLFLVTTPYAHEIIPVGDGSLSPQSRLQGKTPVFFLAHGSRIYEIDAQGFLSGTREVSSPLFSLAERGHYYAGYEKAGKEINFFSRKGERFWNLKSREYPFLSLNGKQILLVTGDHSRGRILSRNGISDRVPTIYGRFITTWGMSSQDDGIAFGFLDGHYYFYDTNGSLAYRGRTVGRGSVKSIAMNRRVGIVHSGLGRDDILTAIHLEKKKVLFTIHLGESFHSKRAISINNERIYFTGQKNLRVFTLGGSEETPMVTGDIAPGHSSLKHVEEMIIITYPGENHLGKMALYFDGETLFRDRYRDDPYVDLKIAGNTFLVRGSDHYWCYRILPEGAQ
jgi:hypothetical protein